jgi:hypothetical protein
MELQQRDNISNLIECWNKTSRSGLNILDQGRMADVWNKRSVSYAKGIEKDRRQKKTDEILAFLDQCGFDRKGQRFWI